MPCFNPIHAYRPLGGGKLVFRLPYVGASSLQVPCGQCIGCRMKRSDEWATRLWHEAQTHDASSFVTLTFDDENLPPDGSIRLRDVQLFIKRLRKHLGHGRVRYFACGEYGDGNNRPHYHAILYGVDFADKYPWRKSASGHLCYRSATLERLWPYGHCEIGTVTRESLGYVARYILKKVGGEMAVEHYKRVNAQTGEITTVRPEFITMSTRPGIGAEWYTRWKTDVFPSDFVIVEGSKKPIPRYYSKKNEAAHEGQSVVGSDASHPDRIRFERKKASFRHRKDNTPDRLATREEVQRRRVERLKREI